MIRLETRRRYQRPRVDFHAWVLDRIAWRGDERVLDVGSGSGAYGPKVRERAPRYIAGDLSLGMLRAVERAPRVNLDVTRLPIRTASCDVVLANHMLYHVADRQAAVAEIGRVLRPGGVLLAATNDALANNPAHVLMRAALARRGLAASAPTGDLFSLANGAAQLAPHFAEVRCERLASTLVFDEAEPAARYVDTTRDLREHELPGGVTWAEMRADLIAALTETIASEGAARVPVLGGAFVCRR